MFSNVGMNPYGPGGQVVSHSSHANPTAPTGDTRSVGGDTPPKSGPSENAERTHPPRQPEPPLSARPELGRNDARWMTQIPPQPLDLSPPDTAAPSGPPPAFDRSPLQEHLQESTSPDPAAGAFSVRAQAEAKAEGRNGPPADAVDPLRDRIRRIMQETGTTAAQPPAEERAAIEFSTTRRMETPYDRATVDVTR